MYVKQISVFIENAKGKLGEFTELIAKNSIDFVSMSIADTTSFGILRGIVSNWQSAIKVIEQAGYTACVNDVLAVVVPDRPGGLANILKLLSDEDISIEYLYSFVRRKGEDALIVFRVEEIDKAATILSANGISMISQEDIR